MDGHPGGQRLAGRGHQLTGYSASACVAILIGCAALLGWAFNISLFKSGLPGLTPMKVNTAISFVCAGVSLRLQIQEYSTPRRMWMARAAALFTITAGTLTMTEYLVGVGLGIDQLFFHDASAIDPGRMAPNTAICFAMLGTALLLLDCTAPAVWALEQVFACAVSAFAFVATVGYAFGARSLYGVTGYTSMSLNTAVGLGVLSIGVIAARPKRGLVANLAEENSAGAGTRRLLPVALAFPFVVGWVRLKGQQANPYGTEYGLALMVTATTGVLAALVLWNGRIQSRSLEAFRQKEKDVARSAEQFRTAIESAPTGILMTDRAGKIVMGNAQIEKLFGYSCEELLGQKVEMLVPERFRAGHADFRKGFFGDPTTRPMGRGRDLFGLRKDGTEVPIEIGLNPLESSGGHFVLCSVADITERKRAEHERERLLAEFRSLNAELEERVSARTADLNTNLKEREVLLQEIHHRVKNNLQVISSLISMQARKLQDGSTRDALTECQNRVEAIALIHEKLYQSQDYARVPFSEYATSLASSIFAATGVSPDLVTLTVEIENLSLAVDKAIPCGLILNELITNALKHAFPNQRHGKVCVELRRAGCCEFELMVRDNGVGIHSEVAIPTESLGMYLVQTLVEQLDGQLQIQSVPETNFLIRFPVEETQ